MCKIHLEEKQEQRNKIMCDDKTLNDSNLLQEAAYAEFPFF